MRQSTLEQQIAGTADLEELDRIGRRYANGGNDTVALLAWLRAEELGCKKYRKGITAMLFRSSVQGDVRRKAEAMVKQWVDDGDADVLEMMDILKAIYSLS